MTVVELEFDISDSAFPIVATSERAACTIRLEETVQRSDGTVLEYVTVDGADQDALLAVAENPDTPYELRILDDRDDGSALLEIVSESAIATALADRRTRVTDIVATAGEGRLVAEVPPRVDASEVVDSFLQQYPEAELRARRITDRTAPTVTGAEFRERLLADLTDRQLQVLRTAHAAGYFDRPRETTTAEIAADLEIADSTLSQHLRVAQRKIFDQLFTRDARR